MQYRTGGEEQEGLEQAVIPHMEKSACQREPTPRRVSLAHCHQRETQPNENDADIFNAVIREQTFEVVLTECKGNTQNGAGHTEERHHPTGLRRHGQPAAESHKSVNA